MLFSSLLFLFAFLPVFLACYYLAPRNWRNGVALAGSLFFYAWGEPVFVVVLMVMAAGVYALSLGLHRTPATEIQRRRLMIVGGVILCLGTLGYCKYSNFVVEQINVLLQWQERSPLKWHPMALPIGVSFFTFHILSYLIDVQRGTAPPARSYTDLLLYVSLFPQLVAGPIVRYHDVSDQLRARDYELGRFTSGLWRFVLGFGRKVLIANPLGAMADAAFNADPATLPAPWAWLGLLAYSFQIYFDFSGYSDMAIGLGRMMGFEFLENFNRPYTSRSITEFWRRWHISLSNFMRDYLYIPLGGSRGGTFRTAANLWLVFLVSGLWHGASWSFIVWGAYHGTLLSIERIIGRQRMERIPGWAACALTFVLASLGWIVFRAETLGGAWGYMVSLARWDGWRELVARHVLAWPEFAPTRTLTMLVIAIAVSFVTDAWWGRHGWDDARPRNRAHALLRAGLGAVILALSIGALAGQSYNPFIYFRF